MPPKRARQPSKLAKSLSLTAVEEREIADAWALFAPASSRATISSVDVCNVLIALGLETPPQEMVEILETLDPDDDGMVGWEQFLEVAALKLKYRDTQEEVEDAFRLFTAGGEGPITIEDLRRVAKELKEDVGEDELHDMMAEATAGRGVDIHAFEAVMKRAGVF